MKRSFVLNNKGSTIVMALMGAGLAATLGLGIATTMGNMSKDQKRLSQKFDVLQIKAQLSSFVADNDSCSCQLQNKKITLAPGNSFELKGISEIQSACMPGAYRIVKVNEKISEDSDIEVASISLVDLKSTGIPDEYWGSLNVEFKQSTTIGSLAPVKVRTFISTNGQKEIQACSAMVSAIAAGLIEGQTPPSKVCKANELFAGFDTWDQPICKLIPSCTHKQILTGIDASGNAICQKIPSCSSGYLLSHFDANGDAVCYSNPNCPPGHVVQSIGASGQVNCVVLPTP